MGLPPPRALHIRLHHAPQQCRSLAFITAPGNRAVCLAFTIVPRTTSPPPPLGPHRRLHCSHYHCYPREPCHLPGLLHCDREPSSGPGSTSAIRTTPPPTQLPPPQSSSLPCLGTAVRTTLLLRRQDHPDRLHLQQFGKPSPSHLSSPSVNSILMCLDDCLYDYALKFINLSFVSFAY
jgi:hypothetical protein